MSSSTEMAQLISSLERRVRDLERSANLKRSSVAITVDPNAPESPVNLDVSGALWTGIEAGVDATAAVAAASDAQATADAATKTYRQTAAPVPGPSNYIPEGAIWYDTDADNRQYRFEGGVWVQVPLGLTALTTALQALVTMRFANAAARTAAIPTPTDGMSTYLQDTGLEYVYVSSSAQWVPRWQYIRKASNTSRTSTTTIAADPHLKVFLVPDNYRIETVLHTSGEEPADIKFAWDFSGTYSSANRADWGPAWSMTDGSNALGRFTGHSLDTEVRFGLDASRTTTAFEDMFITVTAAGTLTLMWAQDTSSSTASFISAASRLYVTKLT